MGIIHPLLYIPRSSKDSSVDLSAMYISPPYQYLYPLAMFFALLYLPNFHIYHNMLQNIFASNRSMPHGSMGCDSVHPDEVAIGA